MLLGALNLTPIKWRRPSRLSPAVVIVLRFPRTFSHRRRRQGVVSELPAGGSAVPAQAAYLTLWTMQQVVQAVRDVSLGQNTRTCIWQGKQDYQQ